MSGAFAAHVHAAKRQGRLLVQPRMGFGSTATMRAGLQAVKDARAATVGTITLDSYTRVGRHDKARRALERGEDLNGYPLVALGSAPTREMLAGIAAPDFPVQVRHGSALPLDIFEAIVASGIDATEGGPVSYCLPYSRVPLREAVAAWRKCAKLFGAQLEHGRLFHIESFGGCMLGQLCPPSLLVAIALLEGLFFRSHGVRSISLSYAQQTSYRQDQEAVMALRRLADELLGDVDRHIVIYTFMGVFPRTRQGAQHLLDESVHLAVSTGAERLIVKTAVESERIPTIAENVAALERADLVARSTIESVPPAATDGSEVYAQARHLIECVLNLHPVIDEALALAFERGYLDVPYCLHADNRNASRAYVGADGRLEWASLGNIPLPASLCSRSARAKTSVGALELLQMLRYNESRCDALAAPAPRRALEPALDEAS